MALIHIINSILADDSLDSEECEKSKCEAIEMLIHAYGWDAVQDALLLILINNERRTRDYEVAAEVFWGAILDQRKITSANKVIALLYRRLQKDEGSFENNLAWSIASSLKGYSYLSDYDPLKDHEVIEEMKQFDSIGNENGANI